MKVITPEDKQIGANLRELRTAKGFSQDALGTALRNPITFQQLQKYEKGTNRVSASKLLEIADVLQVPIIAFYAGIRGAQREMKDYILLEKIKNKNVKAAAYNFLEILVEEGVK
jgi:transcriptional regulator with XRE-family HTH domain